LPGGGLFVPEYGGDDPDSLLTGAGWRFGIANPIGLEGFGVVGVGGSAQKTGWTAGLGIGGFNIAYSDTLPVVVSRTLNF